MFEWYQNLSTVQKVVLFGCTIGIFIGILMLILVLSGIFDNNTANTRVDSDDKKGPAVEPVDPGNDSDTKIDPVIGPVDPDKGIDNKQNSDDNIHNKNETNSTTNGSETGDTGNDIKYKIRISAFGTDCKAYAATVDNLLLTHSYGNYPVFTSNTTVDPSFSFNRNTETTWILDSDGYLRTIYGKNTLYISGHVKKTNFIGDGFDFQTLYSYNKLTLDKNVALKTHRASIFKFGYDPKLQPVQIGNVIYPGPSVAQDIYKTGTCQGYYLQFVKVS